MSFRLVQRLFTLLFLLGIFVPSSFVFAAGICSCTSLDTDCRTVASTPPKGVTPENACTATCQKELGTKYASSSYGDNATGGQAGDAVTYKCGVAHQKFKTSTTPTSTTPADKPQKATITPTLNVDIPGVTFTSTVSGPCSSNPGATCLKSNFLSDYLTGIYQFLIGSSVTIAIVMVMIGGLQYALSLGDDGKIKEAKKRIINATTGLVMLLGVYLILYSVNPQLTLLKMVELQNVPEEGIGNNEVTDAADATASYPAVSVTAGQLPAFKQCAGQWKNTPFKGKGGAVVMCNASAKHPTAYEDNICSSGCGPTSTASVLSYYGLNASPPMVADVASSIGAHTSCSSGTNLVLLCKNIAAKFPGMTCKSIPPNNPSAIAALLAQKKPIVFSCHSCVGKKKDGSDKTYKGHYMVLTGVSGNNFTVSDVGSLNGIVTLPMSEFTSGRIASTYLIEKK